MGQLIEHLTPKSADVRLESSRKSLVYSLLREPEKERKYSPCLNTDISLWWLQLTTEMNVAPSGLNNFYQLFSFTQKQKIWLLLRRGIKGWERSMGHRLCTFPLRRERLQAPSGARETLHPARIALFGLVSWGSNLQEDAEIFYRSQAPNKACRFIKNFI